MTDQALCNRCNQPHNRARCDNCGSPEYRLTGAEAAELKAKTAIKPKRKRGNKTTRAKG